MFNTLAQYFLGTSSNSNTLDPGAKTNHQEVPTNDHGHHSNVDQALAQQTVFQVYPNKRGRARRNRKNKANNPTQKGQRNGSAGRNNNSSSSNNNPTNSAVEDLLEDCTSPDFLLHGITTRICEDEDEWLFVECKASKKSGIISLHDDLLDEDLTCLPDGGVQGYEPVKPRFEIKHNPLNLNQQQLKRQLRQQNASLISCEDIEDDEELMRAVAADSKQVTDEIQVIDPAQSAVVEGNSVDVEVPSVAVELPAESAAQQQQQQAHGDEEPSDLCKAAASEPVAIKQKATQRMEESWFVTPPSCFTSQGPVHMETSPMENLLIEHPSMSVYHNTRSMEQSANIEESLVVLEKEHQQQQEVKMDQQHQEETVAEEQEEETGNTVVTVITAATVERTPVHTNMFTFGDQEDEEEDNEDVDDDDDQEDSDQDDDQLEAETPAVQSQRPFNYVCNREEKQSLLFRNAQMNHDKKMRQKLCRNAMTRSNKTCEMNATKNGPKKRSEKQHAKNQSRANNNRKC